VFLDDDTFTVILKDDRKLADCPVQRNPPSIDRCGRRCEDVWVKYVILFGEHSGAFAYSH
jgi:hypothetical protein